MIDRSRVHKISGPPGTGKSTTLLNVVEGLLSSGTAPEDIVFTTFTRAGAYEARDRACARFKLPAQAFPYFRTIHSLCYQLLPSLEVMTPQDWCAVAKAIGVGFSVVFSKAGESDFFGQVGFSERQKGDYMLHLWLLARVTQRSLKAVFDEAAPNAGRFSDVTMQELHHFIESVQAYKEAMGKMDYTDMLERYLIEGQDMGARNIVVDEAQDLSALQWAVIEKLCKNAQRVWVAGDDDQCIHAWNGASVRHFIELAADKDEVLPQSYRVPATVHSYALRIIEQVRVRIPKEYRPRTEPGTVNQVADLEQLDLRQGSWLLLARNQGYLKEYAALCRRRGVLFTCQGLRSFDERVLRAIGTWHALVAGKPQPKDDIASLYILMSQRDRIRWGFKKKFNESPAGSYTYDQLVKDYGLLAPKDLRWDQALDIVPDDDRAYLLAVQKREGLEASARVSISTIHGAKGREADNVVLMPDMTTQTFNSFQLNPEAEHRVWYVGVTRARKNLFILQTNSPLSYPL